MKQTHSQRQGGAGALSAAFPWPGELERSYKTGRTSSRTRAVPFLRKPSFPAAA